MGCGEGDQGLGSAPLELAPQFTQLDPFAAASEDSVPSGWLSLTSVPPPCVGSAPSCATLPAQPQGVLAVAVQESRSILAAVER